MPLQDHMQIISVDDHLIEHPRVWLDRMPARYQELCPQVVESGDEGMYSEFGTYVKPHSQAWRYEGRIHAQVWRNSPGMSPPWGWGEPADRNVGVLRHEQRLEAPLLERLPEDAHVDAVFRGEGADPELHEGHPSPRHRPKLRLECCIQDTVRSGLCPGRSSKWR